MNTNHVRRIAGELQNPILATPLARIFISEIVAIIVELRETIDDASIVCADIVVVLTSGDKVVA